MASMAPLKFDPTGVEFRPIPDLPGYFAGSDGFIYRKYTDYRAIKKTGREYRKLRVAPQGNGRYLHFATTNGTRNVHRVICETFHGPCPSPKHEASHVNGKAFDNRSSNLAWELKKDNHKRKIEHGTDDCGWRNSRALLSKEKVIALKQAISTGGKTHEQIGKEFGVSRLFVTKVANGHRYARV